MIKTLTFYSNFLLHHQTPFCEAMVKQLGEGFHFVATVEVPQERLDMGYHDYTKESYAINSYESDEKYQLAKKFGMESDVVIIGDAPDTFVEDRIKEGKLTFRCWERFFDLGRWRILDPRVFKFRYLNDIRYRNSNLHMLCASAYTASDCRFIHSYPQKTYRWGYFPEVKHYDDIERIISFKHSRSILWVGRLIDWKHPEDAIFLAEKLKQKGYVFELNIIGEGNQKDNLLKLINEKGLGACIHIHGFMSPERVREWMERADIYLFTSDRTEGWGAVLNESMNSACAVVGCEEIGSVPYLIEDGINGLCYSRKKKDDLFQKVKTLLDDTEKKHSLQLNAYETMKSTWNAEAASERLLHLIDCLQEGKDVDYTTGPCSRD